MLARYLCVGVLAATMLIGGPSLGQPRSDGELISAISHELDLLMAQYRREGDKPPAVQSKEAYRKLRGRVEELMVILTGNIKNRGTPGYIQLMGRLSELQAQAGLAALRLEGGGAGSIMAEMDAIDRNRRAVEVQRETTIRAKKWPPATERAVIEGKIEVGMTAEQVRLAWGEPDQVQSTGSADKPGERWVYQGPITLDFAAERLVTIKRGP